MFFLSGEMLNKKYNRLMRKKLLAKDQRGQTMVEYVLILAVVVAIAIGIFQRLNEFLISNPDSFQNQYLNGFRQIFETNRDPEGNPTFKRYRIPR